MQNHSLQAKRSKISVIDDEPELLETYVSLLTDEFEVYCYSEAKAFLQSLDDSDKVPDLVITDLKMPQMDGLDMILQANKRHHYFPFILLSGYLDKSAVMKAVDAGVYRLLEKPTDYTLLRAAIDQLLLEHDIVSVREEIRLLMSQIRELYTGIRMIMEQYIPEEIMQRMIVDAPDGTVQAKMDFNQLLENLETRLEKLLLNEKMLIELKSNKLKA